MPHCHTYPLPLFCPQAASGSWLSGRTLGRCSPVGGQNHPIMLQLHGRRSGAWAAACCARLLLLTPD